MQTKHELQQVVADASAALKAANKALAEFDWMAKNSVFESKEKAEGANEDKCDNRAFEDCKGERNCGMKTYIQDYMFDGVKYRCTATYEYNRHDKTYYYIDERDFKHEAIA